MIDLIIHPQPENLVTPLIPGVTIALPQFAYLILPILFVITTHELSHGIAANVDGVDVKSTGLIGAGLFYIIAFGAFVEVDEKELYSPKFHRNTRLRIAAAGTFTNALTAGMALLLILNFATLISPLYGAQTIQVESVLEEEQGGFNSGNIAEGDVIAALKHKDSDDDYIYLDAEKGLTLSSLLFNETEDFKCAVGDILKLKIYVPEKDEFTSKEILLGPGYNIGITWEYISNEELQITYIYSKEEEGNNYDKDLEENLIITKINGTSINVEEGKTLEKLLTNFNLTNIKLTSEGGENYLLDVEVNGVRIGILNSAYWMPINDIGKLFTGNLPSFMLIEFIWLWIIALSITLFNMLPLPIFDGDRVVKEIINSAIGEEFKEKKKKKENIYFELEQKEYALSEYRIEKIEKVKIILKEKSDTDATTSEIEIDKKYYHLIDKYDTGYASFLSLELPKEHKISEDSIIEVSYEYWFDEKRKKKKTILNIIRLITLFIVLANFILSFVFLGNVTFWI